MPSKKRPAAATSPELNSHDIAQRAYQRWIARGRPISDGREDWFAAEAELRAERRPTPNPIPAPRRPIRSALRRLGI